MPSTTTKDTSTKAVTTTKCSRHRRLEPDLLNVEQPDDTWRLPDLALFPNNAKPQALSDDDDKDDDDDENIDDADSKAIAEALETLQVLLGRHHRNFGSESRSILLMILSTKSSADNNDDVVVVVSALIKRN
jgi:hypothetical protein